MSKTLRVLSVEDSEDDYLLLLARLRQGGYQPVCRRVDTLEAMEAALAQETWDIVLSDMQMPRFSGFEAIEALKRSSSDLPVIVVTGAIGEEMAAALMKAGASDYINKFNLARLVPAIERELREAAERKHAEAERVELIRRENEARAEAKAAQELDRLKSEFVSSVSHELRTPLTSIQGYAEFLEEEVGGSLSEQQMEFVRQIQRSSIRLTRLVDDLLDFARIDAGTFQLQLAQADLGVKIREIAKSMRPQIEEANLTLDMSVPDEPLSVQMDAQRIGQVLINLIGNAIKFTPPGGEISLRSRYEDDAFRCEIHDTGLGIAPEDIPKLFQRFSQVEGGLKKRGGTGLGLSICKAIIEAHGGTIGVESLPGEGSTFWFTLPRRAPVPAAV